MSEQSPPEADRMATTQERTPERFSEIFGHEPDGSKEANPDKHPGRDELLADQAERDAEVAAELGIGEVDPDAKGPDPDEWVWRDEYLDQIQRPADEQIRAQLRELEAEAASAGGITGTVEAIVRGPDGEIKQREVGANLITEVGDQYYGERAAGIGSPPNQVSGMKLGTGSTAATKAGATAALVTYLSGSHRAIDGTYPQSSKPSSARRITWRSTWAAGVATSSLIREVVIVNEASLTDATTGAANTISRFVFGANIDKGALDSLEISWFHDLLGA